MFLLLFFQQLAVLASSVPAWKTTRKVDNHIGGEILTPDGQQIYVGDPEYSVLRFANGVDPWRATAK